MKRPGEHIVLHEWRAAGGAVIQRWDMLGIVLHADPPTDQRGVTGQWVTVFTTEGCKVRFIGS